MSCFIEVTYISPISNYRFNKTDKFFIIFSASTGYSPIINKIVIDNLANIDDKLRGIAVNRTIKMVESQYPRYKINIFRFSSNTIDLMFTTNLEFDNYEYNQKSNITLYGFDEPKSLPYKDISSFLDEKFFNFDIVNDNNKCILFFTKFNRPRTMVIVPEIINIDDSSKSDIYLFDRYSQSIIKEYIPEFIKKMIADTPSVTTYNTNLSRIYNMHNIIFINTIYKNNNYDRYIKLYSPDTTIYNDSFNKIKMDGKLNYRPLRYDPYINNLMTSPCDSRIRGFKINGSVKFQLYDRTFKLSDMVKAFFDKLDNGAGILCRMTPIDYQRVYMPYSGYLKDIKIVKPSVKNVEIPYYIILRFTSDYFMPKDVGERNYMAVIYGNYMYGGSGVGMAMREVPYLLDIQPNTELIFYIILVGTSYNDSITFSNPKLKNIKNTKVSGSDWYEQGEEISYFNCCGGNVICLFNRNLDYTSDIKFYSAINNGKQMDITMKARDVVAEII